MRSFRFLTLIVLLAATSCASHDAAGRRVDESGRVVHLVLMWLKEPGNVDARKKLIQTSYEFGALPGVIRIRAGEPAVIQGLATRPIDDTSFDVAVVMEFKDQAAYLGYQKSPQHEEAVRDVLRPLTKRVLVYTFANDSTSLTPGK